MKTYIGISLFCLLVFQNLLSQDYQWLILNTNPKIGYNPTLMTNNYGNVSLNNTGTKINGIAAPGPTNADGQPRNDMLIIYNGGEFHCSRFYPSPIWTTDNPEFKVTSAGNAYTPEYLYFTNIYETDDPPGIVTVTNNITSQTLIPTSLNTIRTNQDIVRGSDITLIIPDTIFDSCGVDHPKLNILISKANDGVQDIPILKLKNVFQNNTHWSYSPTLNTITPILNSGYVEQINGISRPGFGKNHFINFNAEFQNNENLVGKQIKFKAQCSNNSGITWTTTETIRDLHDPNKIEVMCHFKKRKCLFLGANRYYVKYSVEFFNDGNEEVEYVSIDMTLPNCAVKNTVCLGNWSFGTTHDPVTNPNQFWVDKTQPGQKVIFHLSEAGHPSNLAKLLPGATPGPAQKGSFKFCVEVTENPEFYSTILQPSQPVSSFEEVQFPIYNYIDPIIRNPNKPNSTNENWVRPNNNCNCLCIKPGDPKPILLPKK